MRPYRDEKWDSRCRSDPPPRRPAPHPSGDVPQGAEGWLSPLLPSILQQYGTSAAELNWINAVYLLSTAVCVPLMSKLGDVYGHRRLLIIVATLVAIGSVIVATRHRWPSPEPIVVG